MAREPISARSQVNQRKVSSTRMAIKTNERRKRPCEEKVRNADRARRTNQFKARGRGGAARPAHNRNHNRSC